MTDPSLTIVIASWNGWAKLQTCLTSIQAGWLPTSIRVIVVDNASTDGTQDKLRRKFPQVELVENQTNRGHTAAINQGFALAQSDYILVLDDDTELAPEAIRRLIDFLDAHPDAGVIGPRLYNTDGSVQESARNFPGVMNGLFGRRSFLTKLWPDNPFSERYLVRRLLDAEEPFQCEQLSGAGMLLRREALAQVGPWDDRYVGYFVDTDWCRSMHRKGLSVYCVPAARVTHHESNARGKRKSAHRIWIFHCGAYQYYTRWHCRGYWDPRSLFAGLMLTARAAILITAFRVKQAKPLEIANLEQRLAPSRPELRGTEP